MSKKSNRGKKSNKHDDVEEFYNLTKQVNYDDNTSSNNNSTIEIDCLIGAILDYYETTAEQTVDEGEEWKIGTEYEMKSKSNIPKELDEAIKKAFLAQIKKLQK